MLAFLGHVAWQTRAAGWLTALAFAAMVLLEFIVLAGVYKLNQDAVRCELEPRRQELETLLMSLKDESPDVSS